jgi:hypothetical protein
MQAPTPPPEALYADLAAIPTVAAGFIVRGAAQGSEGAEPRVLLRRNQKDLSYDEARSHLMQFSSAPTHGGFSAQPFPTELRDVGGLVPSPCGQLLALVRSRTVNSKKEQSIEIWNGDMLVASVKTNAELHGEIYAGDVFASFEWSPDSSALLYVAEAPAAKSGISPALPLPSVIAPAHTATAILHTHTSLNHLPTHPPRRARARTHTHTHTEAHAHNTNTRARARTHTHTGTASYWRDASAPDKGVGREFEYKDDWGELSTGKRVSRVFVLHVPSNTVKMVQGILRHPSRCRPQALLARSCAHVSARANGCVSGTQCGLVRDESSALGTETATETERQRTERERAREIDG